MTDTFTLRVMPKFSIDPSIEILDSHSPLPKEHWLPLVSSNLTWSLGLSAARQIGYDLGAIARHIEAIKIFFYWNRNHGDYQRICANAILVEPGTHNKQKVEAHAKIWLNERDSEVMSEDYNKSLSMLSENLRRALRWQILHFRGERQKIESVMMEFDDLLADVPPQPMFDKAYCGSDD